MGLALSIVGNTLKYKNGFRSITLVKNSVAYVIDYEIEVMEVRGVDPDYEEEVFHLYGSVAYEGLEAFDGETDPNALPETSKNFQELVLFVSSFVDTTAMSGEDIEEILDDYLGSSAWKTGGSGSPAWGAIGGTLSNQTDLDTALGLKADASDVTNASIKTAYEANNDTNAYTDSEKSKLGTVESGATADQSASEIKTAYESNLDTNEYSDAEKTKLASIESGATADQSASEIKTAYEGNSDTNAYTDAEKTKLASIESGATGDLTGAEIETLLDTELGSTDWKTGGSGGGGGIDSVDEDTTPALGGDLALNGHEINGSGDIDITGAISSTGNISTGGNANVTGSVSSNTSSTTGNSSVGGDIVVSGNSDLQGNADVAGSLDVTGGLTAASDVAVGGDIVVTGTVDGRDIAVDGAKLDGIEPNATADQSASEIKTAYESNSNTNAYLDSEKSKLAAIESNADVTDEDNVIPAITGATLGTITPAGTDQVLIRDASNGNALGTIPYSVLASGSGDMQSSTYDPQSVAGDAFDTDNHTDGTTNKVYTAVEKTKLSGIETNATADQTGSEIKSLYEGQSDTNAYTDAEKSKLTAIEASATADQTGAEIKALYEAESDTNAYTDAEKTKLSGIEADATADLTGSEVKTLYEAESDTNALTDALLTKLNGIESGAAADLTASEIESLLDAYYGNTTWRGGNYKGIFDTKSTLESTHATTVAGDWAIVRDGIQLAIDDGSTGWDYQIVEGYELEASTITALEDESHWLLTNVYDTANATAISASDLVAGKKHVDGGVTYECMLGSPNFWVRSGNRTISTIDLKIGTEADDAAESDSTVLVSYRLPYAFYLKNVSVAAGSEGPTGSSAIIDVHSGGTTVFTSTKAVIADASTTGDQSGLATVSLSKGDLIEIYIDQVGSTQAGKGYSVSLQGFLIQA